jgi:lactoylglutathione lyase
MKELTQMQIEHIALWTRDLEGMKRFYGEFFGGVAGEMYHNPKTGFKSYFISFGSGVRLEIMGKTVVGEGIYNDDMPLAGYAHLAFAVGSEAGVDELTARLVAGGYPVASGPRRTGDGYYESCVLDPDGNRVEITV